MTDKGITVGLCRQQTPESLRAVAKLTDSFLDQGFTVDDGRGARGFDSAKDVTPRQPRSTLPAASH